MPTHLLPYHTRGTWTLHNVAEGLQGTEGKIHVYRVSTSSFSFTANLCERLKLKTVDGSLVKIRPDSVTD